MVGVFHVGKVKDARTRVDVVQNKGVNFICSIFFFSHFYKKKTQLSNGKVTNLDKPIHLDAANR